MKIKNQIEKIKKNEYISQHLRHRKDNESSQTKIRPQTEQKEKENSNIRNIEAF